MGLIKKTKASTIAEDARRAIQEGRTVFLARYWDEIFKYQGTGAISGASEAIEQVEEQGWILKDIAYSWVDRKSRGVTVMVFRKK